MCMTVVTTWGQAFLCLPPATAAYPWAAEPDVAAVTNPTVLRTPLMPVNSAYLPRSSLPAATAAPTAPVTNESWGGGGGASTLKPLLFCQATYACFFRTEADRRGDGVNSGDGVGGDGRRRMAPFSPFSLYATGSSTLPPWRQAVSSSTCGGGA